MGTFMMYVSPTSYLSSGVWLASASQWGRNQRASLVAGAAGRPGPTAPGPVGLGPRVQRGYATILSKSGQNYFPSFHEHRRPVLADMVPVSLILLGEVQWVPKTKENQKILQNMVLFCLMLVWHWMITRTWINTLIPSFGEISKFSKV